MVEAATDIVFFYMFHTYFIDFVWSSSLISWWKPCRKVNNVKLGVRNIFAFLQPCNSETLLLKIIEMVYLSYPSLFNTTCMSGTWYVIGCTFI